jgi:hypothetical protein
MFWSIEEIDILTKNYNKCLLRELVKLLPNRSRSQISSKAVHLGLHKTIDNLKTYNLLSLLEDTPQTYYWIGYLLADGHFNGKSITLSSIDRDRIDSFITFNNATTSIYNMNRNSSYTKIYGCTLTDTKVVPMIMQKFSITSTKTSTPPSKTIFTNMSDNLFLSLLIGFIDGDGCIKVQHKRTDCRIQIKIHSNWLDLCLLFKEKLEIIFNSTSGNPKINSGGYTFWSICSHSVVCGLKKKVIELQLDVMNRKWDKIII